MRPGLRNLLSEEFLDNPTWLPSWLYWKVYKFSWRHWVFVFENRISKIAPLASVAGYFIFLSDLAAKHYGFDFVTAGENSVLGLSLRQKLICLYFGVILITLAQFIYLWRRPHTIRRGPSSSEWVDFGLTYFTFGDFSGLHQEIRHEGHRTAYGKYYDDHWNAFEEDAVWSKAGHRNTPIERKKKSRKDVDYSKARERHLDVLISILLDRYEEYSSRRKLSLFYALLLAGVGYLLLLLPSVDLFLTVSKSLI